MHWRYPKPYKGLSIDYYTKYFLIPRSLALIYMSHWRRPSHASVTVVLYCALCAIHSNVRVSGVPEASCDQSHGMVTRSPQENNHCFVQGFFKIKVLLKKWLLILMSTQYSDSAKFPQSTRKNIFFIFLTWLKTIIPITHIHSHLSTFFYRLTEHEQTEKHFFHSHLCWQAAYWGYRERINHFTIYFES